MCIEGFNTKILLFISFFLLTILTKISSFEAMLLNLTTAPHPWFDLSFWNFNLSYLDVYCLSAIPPYLNYACPAAINNEKRKCFAPGEESVYPKTNGLRHEIEYKILNPWYVTGLVMGIVNFGLVLSPIKI